MAPLASASRILTLQRNQREVCGVERGRTCNASPAKMFRCKEAKCGRHRKLDCNEGEALHAYRANCPLDRSRSADALRRHRTGHFLADRRTGRAGTRRHPFRQRRFNHGGQARADVAALAQARRHGSRSLRAAHDDDRTGLSPRRRVRRHAFPSRLFFVFADVATEHAVHHHAARASRPAGASPGLRDLLDHSGGFDFQCAAPTAFRTPTGSRRCITDCPRICCGRDRQSRPISPSSGAFRRRSGSIARS